MDSRDEQKMPVELNPRGDMMIIKKEEEEEIDDTMM
jgi:hypothetical protein